VLALLWAHADKAFLHALLILGVSCAALVFLLLLLEPRAGGSWQDVNSDTGLRRMWVDAACGPASIIVFDYLQPLGVPSCKWSNRLTAQPNDTDLYNCAGYIFGFNGTGLACDYFTGNLSLRFYNLQGPLGPMRMGENLAILGLNNITQIRGNLTIANYGSIGSVDMTTFLPYLFAVESVIIFDANVISRNRPALFTSLPLQSVRVANGISILGTGLTQMSTFSGLQCVRVVMQIVICPNLASLSGLDNLLAINPFSPVAEILTIQGNPLLDAPSKFLPLSVAAGCGSNPRPGAINIAIPACPASIVTFTQLCSYIAGSAPCP
jgi:hypothetical protein